MTAYNPNDLHDIDTDELHAHRHALMQTRLDANAAIRAIAAELDRRANADSLQRDLAALRQKHGVDVQAIQPAGITSPERVNGA